MLKLILTSVCCAIAFLAMAVAVTPNLAGRVPNGDNSSEKPDVSQSGDRGCCTAVGIGNVDGSSDGLVTMGDLTVMIDHLFISLTPLACPEAGNVDLSTDGLITMGDLTVLIDHLFISLTPLPECPLYTAPSTTIIVPQGDTTVIQGYDTTGTINLDGSSVYAQGVSVGDVIIGQDDQDAPDGFLRKVTSKTTQGGFIVLETEPATMMEAFETMDISETHQLRPSDVRTLTLYQGTKFTPGKDDETFNVDLNCVLYDQDGDLETTEDQIKLDGTYAFTAALFANIEMHWFHLERFETGIETTENANIDLIASMQWEFSHEAKFDLAEFKLGAIPVGGVVWLVPTLTVEAHVNGDLTVTVQTGISYTQELRYGFGYANDVFYDISESTRDFTYTPPQFTAEFNFETGASLNASCLLYGVAGPYMGGKAGLHFQSVLSVDPCDVELTFDLEAILYAVVGVKCDILGLDYNKAYQLYTHPIGEWEFPLGGTGAVVIDAEPNSLNAPWSLAGPCSYSTSDNGDNTLTSLDPGEYTITWGAVSGWTAPANSSQTLAANATVTFSGTYVEESETPTVITAAVSAITETTAECGGNITSDGGTPVTVRGVCWSTSPTPTVADSKTTDGAGTGSFTSSLASLTANTPYYVRAYATNSAGTGYGNEVSFTTAGAPGTVTDIDGNVYQTVPIGNQVWMAENLKVTHYRNGDSIPHVTNNGVWSVLASGAYCNYGNDEDTVATYGRLYNWYAVGDPRNIAPAGWHVPTDEEWKQLEMYLGMSPAQADGTGWRGTNEGGKLKETGTAHWISPNTGATNESGFTALPGGTRLIPGSFNYMGSHALFWSSTQYGGEVWIRYLNNAYSQVLRSYYDKRNGLSVRCVKDAESTVTDFDGNVYSTVTIGNQVWMAENLKVTHYRNGEDIPNVTDSASWPGLTTGAYCEYNNDVNNVATYGRLYNWYAAVDSRNIAPVGWHVPSDAEWKQLEMYLGMSQAEADAIGWRGTDEGGKLKEAGTTHWFSPNTGATNESGFTALPGGYRNYYGGFDYMGSYATFWSATERISGYAWLHYLGYSSSQIFRDGSHKHRGFSIRCVRDY